MLTFKLHFTSLLFFILAAGITVSQPVTNEHSIKFENPTTATLVGENGVIMRTVNNGANWEEQNSNISNVLFGNSVKHGTSLAVGENGVILRSLDNGANWTVFLPGTTENLNDVELVDVSKAFVCGNNGTLLYSSDNGQTWSTITTNTTKNLTDIKFVNTQVGFVTGDLGALLKTQDGGLTWTALDMSFTNNKFNSVEAIDANNLVLVGDMGKILLSNDGGDSWFGPSGVMYESDFNDVVFFDANNGVIAANDGLILKTTDGGYSWVPSTIIVSGDDYDYFSVAFADANNGISIGRNGVEIYTTDGGTSWTESAPLPGDAFLKNEGKRLLTPNLRQNYPNPFNPSTVISYEIPLDAKVSIRVSDMLGKEVALLVSTFQKAGSYTVNFNANGLSSGVYFYSLSAVSGDQNYSSVMKMILTK